MKYGEKLMRLVMEYQESCTSEDAAREYTRDPEVIAAEYEATIRAMMAS